jgi:hypothetical protein
VTGKGHLYQVLFAISNPFFNGTDNVASFANANTHLALFITHHNDGSKAHFFTTFHGFRDAADLNNPFLPFGIAFLIATVAALFTFTPAFATVAFTLPFGSGGNISGAGNLLGLDLVVGFSHGFAGSELKARFPGCFGKGFNPTVVQVAAAVEDHLLNAFGKGTLGNQLANSDRCIAIGTTV